MTYQLKITLADSEPEVWRRVLVSEGLTLAELHGVIQQAMGWEDLHEYRFAARVGQAPLEIEQRLSEAIAPSQTLDATAPKTTTLYYTYDFQSGWLHRIDIESADAETPEKLPTCTEGKAACPPEGAGGVWGYDELLARLENTDDPDYLELIDKYSSFDPDAFNIDQANQRLSA